MDVKMLANSLHEVLKLKVVVKVNALLEASIASSNLTKGLIIAQQQLKRRCTSASAKRRIQR